jgi:aromatic ring hydroxylase
LVRTIKDYINSLNDGRNVWYRGVKIPSIAEHPILSIAVKHLAKLYELPNRVYEDKELGHISMYYRIPRNANDLLERHKMIYNHTYAATEYSI